MRRLLITGALAVVLVLAMTAPAMAFTGEQFGLHHAEHAAEMNGFTGDVNPGMHQGFTGWTGP